jgi:hypothetical protein
MVALAVEHSRFEDQVPVFIMVLVRGSYFDQPRRRGMLNVLKHVLFALILVLIVPLAVADDGFSELGAGGLVFSKTNAISMEKEVLQISPDRINVSYEFRNLTSRDVRD